MTTEPTTPAPPASPRKSSNSARLVWLIVGLIAVVGLVTWLVTKGGDDDKSSAVTVKTGVPTVMPEADLRAFGRAQGRPVYWAGPLPNRRYEMTRTSGGRYFVRYLTPKADVGDAQPRFLTVGTYPGTKAYAALEAVGKKEGFESIETQSGALVVYDKERPTSVYFAFPDQNFQVETYDPRDGRALRFVLEGKVERLR